MTSSIPSSPLWRNYTCAQDKAVRDAAPEGGSGGGDTDLLSSSGVAASLVSRRSVLGLVGRGEIGPTSYQCMHACCAAESVIKA